MKARAQTSPATISAKPMREKASRVRASVGKDAKQESYPTDYDWGPHDCALMAESVLAKDWLSEEDEKAWAKYQPK